MAEFSIPYEKKVLLKVVPADQCTPHTEKRLVDISPPLVLHL
jgi:hypothetical protein